MFEGHKSNIHFILSFGSHLISVDEESTVRVWLIQTTGTLYMAYIASVFNPLTPKPALNQPKLA